MKKIILFIISSVIACGMIIAQDNTIEIPVNKVPDLGLKMLKTYFPKNTVVKALKNKTMNIKNRTYVVLDNNAVIDFDKDGNWMIVDCRQSEIPKRMVPGKVLMFLDDKYYGFKVLYMDREIVNGDIYFLLDDGTELQFTNDFKLIGERQSENKYQSSEEDEWETDEWETDDEEQVTAGNSGTGTGSVERIFMDS